MLLVAGHELHLRHLHLLVRLPKTDQSIDILCIMGQYALQYCNIDVTIGHESRINLAFLPVPGFSHPDVSQQHLTNALPDC